MATMNINWAIELYGGGAGSGCNPEVAQPRCGRPSGTAPESSTVSGFENSHYHYRPGSESRRVARTLQDGQWHPVQGLERNPGSTRRVDWANMRITAHQHGMEIERRGGQARFVRLTPEQRGTLVAQDQRNRDRWAQQARDRAAGRTTTPASIAPVTVRMEPLTRSRTVPDFGLSGPTRERVFQVLQDGGWHSQSELDTARTDTTHPRPAPLDEALGAIRDGASRNNYQLQDVEESGVRRFRLTPIEGGSTAPTTAPVSTPITFHEHQDGTGPDRVQRVLRDGEWHTESELAGGHGDLSFAISRINEAADQRNLGYRTDMRELGGNREYRLVRTNGEPLTSTAPLFARPTITPIPEPTSSTPAPKITSPSSQLGAFGFNPNGRAEAGARVLLDGQWHDRAAFDQAVMDPTRTAHGISSTDQALSVIRSRMSYRNLGMIETGPDGTLRLRPAPPPPPPGQMPPPLQVTPNPSFRKEVGSLKKEDAPTSQELEEGGIRIARNMIQNFRQDFQMSPQDYRDLVVKGLPQEAIGAPSVTINGGSNHEWSISMNTASFDQTRSFNLSPDVMSMYHSSWSVNADYQGKDVGKQVFGNQLDLYDHLGIKKVSVSAGLSVGGYAWARYGFVPSQSSWDRIRESAKTQAYRFPADVAARIRVVADNPDPRSVWVLAAMKDKGLESGHTVGQSLLLGKHWDGTIDLTNKEQYENTKAYVKEPKIRLHGSGAEIYCGWKGNGRPLSRGNAEVERRQPKVRYAGGENCYATSWVVKRKSNGIPDRWCRLGEI